MADLIAQSHQALVSMQEKALETIIQELKRALTFMHDECPEPFLACFEAHGWPSSEIPKMIQD